MIRYALTTFAGVVEVRLDIPAAGDYGTLTFDGPEEALPHVRADVTSSYGSAGRLMSGAVSADDLRFAMASPYLRSYAPKLLEG